MVKLLNLVCLIELVLGIVLAFLLPSESAYIFGGGLILGAVFTFLITLGLGLMTAYEEQRQSKVTQADKITH
ncbi:hypothetical protein GCM10011391_11220 [Pullulanibacillus camelliae]|uniref:Uncharacterized protein n=1 Tax=Pullulanibacillus camelliae TaxID=1707096 RepID=A0A8J2VR91_9BACL|nr:hypothetical protein [Pullulanibacillus camelliae]GGE34278.1 hypothetical protein GCM10011391_11220 [Pullulanibacillus camelliae]